MRLLIYCLWGVAVYEGIASTSIWLKFIYSERATKCCEIYSVDLSYVVTVKSTVEISQNFVAFSEYMNFNYLFYQDIQWILLGILQIARQNALNFWMNSYFYVSALLQDIFHNVRQCQDLGSQ